MSNEILYNPSPPSISNSFISKLPTEILSLIFEHFSTNFLLHSIRLVNLEWNLIVVKELMVAPVSLFNNDQLFKNDSLFQQKLNSNNGKEETDGKYLKKMIGDVFKKNLV